MTNTTETSDYDRSVIDGLRTDSISQHTELVEIKAALTDLINSCVDIGVEENIPDDIWVRAMKCLNANDKG